jgi:hypothetical protein
LIRKHRQPFGLWLFLSVVCLLAVGAYAAQTVTHNFAGPADLAAWQMDQPADWEILKEGDLGYLHMKRAGEPGVPRRPLQFARLRNVQAGSFDLEVKVRRLQKSVIVVFNYVDTLHFYYTHLSVDAGSDALPHNGIFIVDGGPRRRIAGAGSGPALPDQAWHDVKVVRNVPSGLMQVYVDHETTPRFSVVDHTFTRGQVGLGSFDETGDFAMFQLHAID